MTVAPYNIVCIWQSRVENSSFGIDYSMDTMKTSIKPFFVTRDRKIEHFSIIVK